MPSILEFDTMRSEESLNNVDHRLNSDNFLPPNNSIEPLWTVEDLAAYLKLQPETIRMMARRGELPAYKIGKVWRFQKNVIHDMLSKME